MSLVGQRSLDRCTFQYEVPLIEIRVEARGIRLLEEEAAAAQRAVVHVCCTNQAQNQYLGQFVVSAVRPAPSPTKQVFERLRIDPAVVRRLDRRWGEARAVAAKLGTIRRACPRLRVCHEPEGVSHIDAPVRATRGGVGWVSAGTPSTTL